MIISASRRTDIPAFFADWFINRIKAGFCVVPNPFNVKQLAKVSLLKKDVDVIVFWTKNPKPIIPRLKYLDENGYKYYFQFTLNGYPRFLEPRLPRFEELIDTFIELSNFIGNKKVIWRYDPIIISTLTNSDYHIKRFNEIAATLNGFANRVMISLVDFYRKADIRLKKIQEDGFNLINHEENIEDTKNLLKELVEISKNNKIEPFTCAEPYDFGDIGLNHGSCIDKTYIQNQFGIFLNVEKDKYQRPECLCAQSKDIGIFNTCLHACTYCYATKSHQTAIENYNTHNSNSPSLIGNYNLYPEKSSHDKNSQSNLNLWEV